MLKICFLKSLLVCLENFKIFSTRNTKFIDFQSSYRINIPKFHRKMYKKFTNRPHRSNYSESNRI